VLLGHGDGTFATPKIRTSRAAILPASRAETSTATAFPDLAVTDPDTDASPYWLQHGGVALVRRQRLPLDDDRGDAHTITVTAKDNAGKPLTNYTGTGDRCC